MVRVITQLPNYDLYESQKVARLAESVGFDGVIALENAHNPFLPLAASAMVTDRIQLGTAVAMAFPRAPTIAAHAAWDIQNASKGRFNLGLGAQVKAHNERRDVCRRRPPRGCAIISAPFARSGTPGKTLFRSTTTATTTTSP